MSTTYTTFLYFIILFLLSFTVHSSQDCTSPDTDDGYYDIQEHITLDKREKAILDNFSKRLVGDWRGELVQIECKGNIKQPEKFVDSSYADVEIKEHSKNRLKMKAELDFRKQNKKTLYFKPFLDRRYLQSYLFNGPDIAIIVEKHYQHSHRYGGNTLIETIYKFILNKEQLQLDIITLNNGYFSTEQRWSLTK